MASILTKVDSERQIQLYLWPLCWDAWYAACQMRQLPTDFVDYVLPEVSLEAQLKWWNEQVDGGHALVSGFFGRDNDRFLGTLKAFDFNAGRTRCEIGIELLNPHDYGQGFGSAGLSMWLAYLKDQGFKQVYGLIHPGNARSLKLFRRLGFSETGIVTDAQDPELRFVRVEKQLST